MPDRPIPTPEFLTPPPPKPGSETDLGKLAALFAAHSGGNFSPEVSNELALEIVLNEIVEQACLATGATGAAVMLEREGEMVCRASNGTNAPEMGARLGGSGLTAECVKTRQVQCCDDAQSDPRADTEASRTLGVRAVVVVPILRNDKLVGALEVLSSRPAAFGERDVRTVEALAQRILKNLERASEPMGATRVAAEPPPGADLVGRDVASNVATNEIVPVPTGEAGADDASRDLAGNVSTWEGVAAAQSSRPSPAARFDIVTFSLAAAVVACAILLVTLIGVRLTWKKGAAAPAPAPTVIAGETKTEINAATATAPSGTESLPMPAGEKAKPSAPGRARGATEESVPGGLVVYEKGKEVFRMTPGATSKPVKAAGQSDTQKGSSQNGALSNEAQRSNPPEQVQQASSVEHEQVVNLSPEAAQSSLLYRVEPEYPEAARQQKIQGAVVLDVRIGKDGAVQGVNLVSGPALLADAATAAVKQWRFKPRVQHGQTVEMQTRVTLKFRMQ